MKTVKGKALYKALTLIKRKRRFKPSNKLINIKINIKTNFNIVVAL